MSLFHGASTAYTSSGSVVPNPDWIYIEQRLTASQTNGWSWLLWLRPIETYALPPVITCSLVIAVVNALRTMGSRHSQLETHICGLSLATSLTLLTNCILLLPRYVALGTVFPMALPYLASLIHWFWLATVWQLVGVLSHRALSSTPPPIRKPRTAPAGLTCVAVFLVTMATSAPRLWQYNPLVPRQMENNATILELGRTPLPMLDWLYHVTGLLLPTPLILGLCALLCWHNHGWYRLFENKAIPMGSPALLQSARAQMSTNRFCLVLVLMTLPLCTPLPLLHLSFTAFNNNSGLLHSAPFLSMQMGLGLLFYIGLLLMQTSLLIGSPVVQAEARSQATADRFFPVQPTRSSTQQGETILRRNSSTATPEQVSFIRGSVYYCES